MRRPLAALAGLLVTAGVLAVAPSAHAATCGGYVQPSSPHGFTWTNATFDADSLNVSGDQTTEGYFDKAVSVPLTANQADYSILTDEGQDNYKQGFAYYLGIANAANPAIDNLFYEPAFYGNGVWHSGATDSNGSYLFTGTLADFLSQNPNATVTDFAGNDGSGVPANTESVQTVTFQGCTWRFAVAPRASFTVNNAGDTNYRTFGFNAAASKGNSLTYTWHFGDGTSGHGKTVQHTFPTTRGKTYYVKLTVSDGFTSNTETRKVLVS